jgi:hypothetical protein
MTIGYILWAALLAIAFLGITLGTPIHQALTPVPEDDMAEIVRFLGYRDQTPFVVKKLIWSDIPQSRFGANLYGRPKNGRFYRVRARDADGSEYRHELAIEGGKPQIDLLLYYQGPEGFWTKALQ